MVIVHIVIMVTKPESHSQLTFYVFSTSTLRANFGILPPSVVTIIFRIYFIVNHGCVAELDNIYDIDFKVLSFSILYRKPDSKIYFLHKRSYRNGCRIKCPYFLFLLLSLNWTYSKRNSNIFNKT